MNKWRIWFKRFDKYGNCYGGGVAIEEYVHKSSAVRAAKKRFGTCSDEVEWIVSQENPCGVNEYYKDRVIDRLCQTL